MLIDLHTHSNASDGTDSPSALIDKAISRGLDIVALTDHDTIAGWSEATTALKEHGTDTPLEVVLGAEISCQDEDGVSIHMLGLLFDSTYLPLLEDLRRLGKID